jgi:aminoglycoside 6'-N-acetyltransferase
MILRHAAIDDLDLLRRWDDAPHVANTGGDPDFNDWDWETELDREVGWREMLIAEVDGRPIGFLQIIDPANEESHYWGNCDQNLRAVDIWIGEADCLRKGYGTAMMKHAIGRCFADPAVTAILIDPMADNVAAHRFYESLGFRFVERRFFGPDDCFVFKLDRAAWREGERHA